MHKYLYLIALFCLSLAACTKEPVNNNVVLSGQIIDSSTNQPIALTTFVFYSTDYKFSTGTIIQKLPFATDSNGRFRFTFDSEGYRWFKLYWPDDVTARYGIDSPIFKYEIPAGAFPYSIDIKAIYTKL